MSRRPARTSAVIRILLAVGLVALIAGCTNPPTGEQAVSFQSELQEAEKMVADAAALTGTDAVPEHENSSGGNIAGAPDPSNQRRAIEVQWVDTEPPPFAAIRDLWTGTYGYTVTSESADSVHLAKGEMTARIGQGMSAPDGRRNVFFGVVTGLHPAAEVPEPP